MKCLVHACVSVLLLVASAGCVSRANPRLAELEVDSGANRTVYTMSYTSTGELDEIEVEVNGETSYTLKYTWDSGQITRIETDNVGADDVTRDLEWDGATLVSKTEEGDNYTADTDYTYDDSGRLSKVEKHTNFQGDSTSDVEWEFDYDSQGRLDEWNTTTRFEIFGIDSTDTTSYDFRYDDDGRLESADPGAGSDIEFSYNDDGSIDDADTGDRIRVTYDDQGRIDRIEDGSTDFDYKYTDTGEATGVIFTPTGLPFSELFDLAGKSHSTIPVESFNVLHQ